MALELQQISIVKLLLRNNIEIDISKFYKYFNFVGIGV